MRLIISFVYTVFFKDTIIDFVSSQALLFVDVAITILTAYARLFNGYYYFHDF